jgi:hypothetical protein
MQRSNFLTGQPEEDLWEDLWGDWMQELYGERWHHEGIWNLLQRHSAVWFEVEA